MLNTPQFGLPNSTVGAANAGYIETVINPEQRIAISSQAVFLKKGIMTKHLLCILALAPIVATAQERPNIVFILSDDMGWATEPYGVKDIQTPAISRLAKEGVRLTQSYSNGPLCSPTRTAFLTGRIYSE